MDLKQIILKNGFQVLTREFDFSAIEVTNGYVSDLMSCVMAGASKNDLWVTLQSHSNIVAIAALLDLSAVIITENSQPDEDTITKANQENIILLSTPLSSFDVVGKLWESGVRA